MILESFNSSRRLGWVLPEGVGYQCFPAAPNMVRRPDASFIRYGCLPGEQLPKGYIKIAPHLAIEVLSPKDLAYAVDEKIEEYLGAGVRLVWIVNPATRTVRIHRAIGPGTTLRTEDEISGEEIIPGFRCTVGDFFVIPQEANPSDFTRTQG
jgi:Uma2 family endonuclease